MNRALLFTSLLLLSLAPNSNAHATHVLDEAFGQYLDIAQLEAGKFELVVDDYSYVLYYGYHGSMDAMGELRVEPTLSEVIVNQENQSLEITFSEVPEKTDFWLRFPFEVLVAEKEHYQVFIDGVDTGYDLSKFPNEYAIGMILPQDAQHVEIVGSKVIPEFGTFSILILGIAIFGIVYFVRKSTFDVNSTRIN